MRILHLLLKLILGFFVITLTAIAALFLFVDPNDFKEDISQVVKQHTGREFEMQSIHLSLYPMIGLEIKQAKLSNAPGFSDRDFAQIDAIQLGAQVLPLFSQQLVVDAIALEGLNLSLEQNAQAKNNWQDLLQNSENEPSPAGKSSPAPTPETSSLEMLKTLQFGGLEIYNASIIWADQLNQQTVELNGLNIQTDAIQMGQYFNVNVDLQTKVSQPELLSQLQLRLQAKLTENGKVFAKQLIINNQLTSSTLPFKAVSSKFKVPTLSFDLPSKTVNLAELSLEQTAQGQTGFVIQTLNQQLQLKQIALDLHKQHYSIEQILLNAQVSADQFGLTKTDNIQLKTRFSADLAQQTAHLTSINLTALGTQTSAELQVADLLTQAKLKGQIQTKSFNVKTLLDQLNIPLPAMASANALSKFEQSTKFHFDSQSQTLEIPEIMVVLDQSTLQGATQIQNFSNPAVQFEFALNQITLDDYLPPQTEPQASQPQETSEPAKTEPADLEIPLPKELLRQLDLQGQIDVTKLRYQNLNPKNLHLKLQAKDGKIEITPAKVDIFDTQITTNASLDVRQAHPAYSVKLSAPNVPVGEVLLAFTDNDPLSGLGSIQANLTSQGDRLSSLKASLSGKADIYLENGAIKGINLAQMIRDAKAKLSGKAKTPSQAPKKTDFSQLIAKVDLNNGLVTSREVSAMSPFLRIQGDGQAHLAKETVDFLVTTKIVGTSKGQGGADLEELKGLPIPLRIKGNLYTPKFSIDLKSLVNARMKQQLEAKKAELKAKAKEKQQALKQKAQEKAKEKLNDELEEKLGSELKEKLPEALKGLF